MKSAWNVSKLHIYKNNWCSWSVTGASPPLIIILNKEKTLGLVVYLPVLQDHY